MKLKSKKYIKYEGNVHDITVENTHSYNIQGLAVHNSSAGSLVAYLTGITDVDPIEYDLIFERFHNNQKKSFPDIDTDFSNPALVKEYIKEKYGEDKVASISNWSRLSPKVVVKDVARSLRLGGDKSSAFQISNHITSIMPDTKTLKEATAESSQFDSYMKKYPELYEYGEKLQNLTRNWSVHAAGLVIGEEPLHRTVPLRVDDDGGVVTQWEKTRCEDNGLIKMDLLGLKTLTVIDNTFKIIKESCGEDISIDDIDLNDKEVYDMLGRGETSGVFQLESSLTPFCIKLKPQSIEDISAINAIGRPSCLPEERKKYAKRRLGIEKPEYDHPALERALKKTYGVLVYEEQAMFIAQDCAGWDLNQADSLRKISKLKGKDQDLLLKTEANFIKDCMSHSGMDYKTASLIWKRYILVLSGYAFNKSLTMDQEVSIIRNEEQLTLEIQHVKRGDLVRSRDEKTKEEFHTVVIENHYHGKLPVYEITLETGETVKCTMNHKFRTTTGQMLPLWWILQEDLDIVVANS